MASNTAGFEFRGEDDDKLRVTFALDYCDRKAIGWVASGNHIREVMLKSVGNRFGQELPAAPVQWLSDSCSIYTAEQTCALARRIYLLPLATSVCSPQSHGMAWQ